MKAATRQQIEESRATLRKTKAGGQRSFRTAEQGRPAKLPAEMNGPARLVLESGEAQDIEIRGGRLQGVEETGYHRLETKAGELVLAVAPPRCFGIADLNLGRQPWGAAVQLPSIRDEAQRPFGDFAALRGFAEALARRGADALAISPVHAGFPSDPGRYSPYGPSSRRFLNVLYADPSLVGAALAKGSGTAPDLIDWEAAIPQRMEELRRIFDALPPETRVRISNVEHMPDEELERHARFDALDAHFREREQYGWQSWPEPYHASAGEAVDAFAAEHAEDVAFYRFLQGLADRSLRTAQRAAKDAGMAVGLISDLAVGVDPGGSETWSAPGQMLQGLSVGAPPDLLGPAGQDWGLTTFDPLRMAEQHFAAFRATLRAALAAAGGVRIDHILGLRRIWVVPHGASPAEGCYLSFPQTDMFRLLALESQRNGAIVVGEDLGTVPEGLRDEMAANGMLGMRVLWFEQDEDGAYIDPADWDAGAAAMTSTHDLPTVAGWWRGRDIDWTWKIGRKSPFDSEKKERAARAKDRKRLWKRFVESGSATGTPPPLDRPQPVVTAAAAHVAGSACDLALIPAEDLFGLEEQPNLPGTMDEHPNWRRRLPSPAGELFTRPEVEARLRRIDEARRA